jgi:DNA ligase-1
MIKRPMKGVALDDLSQVQLPCYGSPKIDGFRCLVGRQPLTSRLGPYRNPFVRSELSGLFEDAHPLLDGELVVGEKRGPGVLQRTSSGVTNGQGKPDFTLWVFDTPQAGYGFRDRLELANQIVTQLGHDRIRFLRHKLLSTTDELERYAERCLERGYEGIITRSVHGPYKEGKSTLREQSMLKYKPFIDAEGRIKGWYEEQENTNEAKRDATNKLKRSSSQEGKKPKGTLGGLILEDCTTKVEVRVGGGFSAEQRRELWKLIQRDPSALKGKLVRYKKQKVGEKDKPRHPNFVEFVDFRPEWDFTE